MVSKFSLIQGFRAPRVIGFQDMWDISLIYPQGIGFPLLTGAFEKFGVSKIQGFQGTSDTPGRYPTPLGALR